MASSQEKGGLMSQSIRRRYPSDVSEVRWRMIETVIADSKPKGRKRVTDLREVVNAINYRWTTGCPWRMLPHDYPSWETVYTYFSRWQRAGKLRQIREILLRKSPYLPAAEIRLAVSERDFKLSQRKGNLLSAGRVEGEFRSGESHSLRSSRQRFPS